MVQRVQITEIAFSNSMLKSVSVRLVLPVDYGMKAIPQAFFSLEELCFCSSFEQLYQKVI